MPTFETGPWDAFFDWRTQKWRAFKLDGTRAGDAGSEDYEKVMREVALRNFKESEK